MQISNRPRLILGSASPARRTLLKSAGIDVDVIVSGVDESAVEAVSADTLCQILARLKAAAVAERVRQSEAATLPGTGPATLVLGCDSVLAFDGEILGKPADADDAVRRWQAMRGRSGTLYTGHSLVDVGGGRVAEGVAATVVHFADVSDDEIKAYVGTGEPLHVAGSFTIDGLGGAFVERIEGDHGTVVGLSLPLLRRLVAELGHSITDFWTAD
ncbi:septum formation protein [Catenuloplanes nepalensis]|uniref:Nucleoside triphosphate pyrophosphatase n=1 Tax=Catenuloplanes nepalensis TaxID=587533 RepID=A0ABT9N260_9ACTN|nr:nucleoside triphosphate pyrophosphatase [Catenuloplanes nepalensis]MDP9797770.1 septum formation protein [Catenuloplanes nepalensis]